MICPPGGHVYRVAQDAMGVGSGKILASWRISTNHAQDGKSYRSYIELHCDVTL